MTDEQIKELLARLDAVTTWFEAGNNDCKDAAAAIRSLIRERDAAKDEVEVYFNLYGAERERSEAAEDTLSWIETFDLWWLQPGWTDAVCGCGARIYPEGDPGWGQCFTEEMEVWRYEAFKPQYDELGPLQ